MNSNDPSFPTSIQIEDNNGSHYEEKCGLTKREWLAGQALQGAAPFIHNLLISTPRDQRPDTKTIRELIGTISSIAVLFADDTLEKLEENEP